MITFIRYTYHNPDVWPVEWDNNPYPYEWDKVVMAAGFDPADQTVACGHLFIDWGVHLADALVVRGNSLEGHRFAVECHDTSV